MEFDKFHIDAVIVSIIALISSICAPALLELLRYNLKQRAKKAKNSIDLVLTSLQENIDINDRLLVLKDAIGADRASIYMFHNGEEFYSSNMHIKFLSKVFVKPSPGITSDWDNSQRIPIQSYMHILPDIQNKGDHFIEDSKKMESNSFQMMLKTKGVKSGYYFRIQDLTQKTIGILSVSFIKSTIKLNEDQITSCKIACDQLAGYLIRK